MVSTPFRQCWKRSPKRERLCRSRSPDRASKGVATGERPKGAAGHPNELDKIADGGIRGRASERPPKWQGKPTQPADKLEGPACCWPMVNDRITGCPFAVPMRLVRMPVNQYHRDRSDQAWSPTKCASRLLVAAETVASVR